MEEHMSMEEVRSRIQYLQENGEVLSKKKVKQQDPELMRSALYYFPSWDHAIEESSIS